MPERLENLDLLKPVSTSGDTAGDALRREAELLGAGLTRGAVQRVQELVHNPEDALLLTGASFGIGAALNIASRAGGVWGGAAKVGGALFLIGTGYDMYRRAVPTLGAVADTWASGANLEHNKDVVAKFAGSAIVDYPLAAFSGYAGFRVGGLKSMPLRVTIAESVPAFESNRAFDKAPFRSERSLNGMLNEPSPINTITADTRGILSTNTLKAVGDAAKFPELPGVGSTNAAMKDAASLVPKGEAPANNWTGKSIDVPLNNGAKLGNETIRSYRSDLRNPDLTSDSAWRGDVLKPKGGPGGFGGGGSDFGPFGSSPKFEAVAEMGGPPKMQKVGGDGGGFRSGGGLKDGSGGGFGGEFKPPRLSDLINSPSKPFGSNVADFKTVRVEPLNALKVQFTEPRPYFIPGVVPTLDRDSILKKQEK